MVDFAAHARRILSRLGEEVTYTPQGGVAVTVRGVFKAPYAETGIGGAYAVAGNQPAFTAMADDLPDLARGDAISRAGTDYEVAEIHPDRVYGSVILVLEEA